MKTDQFRKLTDHLLLATIVLGEQKCENCGKICVRNNKQEKHFKYCHARNSVGWLVLYCIDGQTWKTDVQQRQAAVQVQGHGGHPQSGHGGRRSLCSEMLQSKCQNKCSGQRIY